MKNIEYITSSDNKYRNRRNRGDFSNPVHSQSADCVESFDDMFHAELKALRDKSRKER